MIGWKAWAAAAGSTGLAYLAWWLTHRGPIVEVGEVTREAICPEGYVDVVDRWTGAARCLPSSLDEEAPGDAETGLGTGWPVPPKTPADDLPIADNPRLGSYVRVAGAAGGGSR